MWRNVIETSSVQMMCVLKVGRLGRANELYVDLVDLCLVAFLSSHVEDFD